VKMQDLAVFLVNAYLVILFLFSVQIHLRILYTKIRWATGYHGSHADGRDPQPEFWSGGSVSVIVLLMMSMSFNPIG
jgi:hypothetical protein